MYILFLKLKILPWVGRQLCKRTQFTDRHVQNQNWIFQDFCSTFESVVLGEKNFRGVGKTFFPLTQLERLS